MSLVDNIFFTELLNQKRKYVVNIVKSEFEYELKMIHDRHELQKEKKGNEQEKGQPFRNSVISYMLLVTEQI